MDFGEAIRKMKGGWHVARVGWNGKDMDICIQVPDYESKMDLPYIYMKTAQGDLVPWLASQTDMLAEDWEVVWLMGQESDQGYQIRSFFVEPYYGHSPLAVDNVQVKAPGTRDYGDEAHFGERRRDERLDPTPGTQVANTVSERPGRIEEALGRMQGNA